MTTPRLTTHERVALPVAIDFMLALYEALRMTVFALPERAMLDAKARELRRLIAAGEPNTYPAPPNPPPTAPQGG